MTVALDQRSIRPFGVEIEIDLHDKESEARHEALRQLLATHGLLVFRALSLSMEEQCRFCRIFGPVPDSAYENFYVSNTREDGFLGTKELQWHNDVPYLPSPYLVAALHAVDVGHEATSTRFASGMLAYDRLPEQLRERLKDLKALQVRQRVADRANRLDDLLAGDLCTVHPVVRNQDATGRPYIFVNENMTACIIGLSSSESDTLLQELYSYLYAEDLVYEHVWRPGDLVVWDNLVLQHARGRLSAGTRTLQRVTCTQFTYAEQYPADVGIGQELHNERLLTVAGEV